MENSQVVGGHLQLVIHREKELLKMPFCIYFFFFGNKLFLLTADHPLFVYLQMV